MIIIKVGGGEAINKTGIAHNIKDLKQKVVFVHGAAKTRNNLAEELGQSIKRVTSPSGQISALTNKRFLDISIMAYAGLTNKKWVETFQQNGINAVGLSGADGKIWQGKRKPFIIAKENDKEKLIKDTWTGKIDKVNGELINLLLGAGYLPVITQPAISKENELINTDNDRNLAVMARELGVKELVILFEAPGLLKDHTDETSLIKEVKKENLPKMLEFAQGTMKKKILGAIESFEAGVKTIYWGDSRVEKPIKDTLAGKGTIIK